jgi:ABC-type amino acid transport system permease subunit
VHMMSTTMVVVVVDCRYATHKIQAHKKYLFMMYLCSSVWYFMLKVPMYLST